MPLQIHYLLHLSFSLLTPLNCVANYDNLERDARLCTILMSPTPDFSSITAMTDAWVVDGDIWVGDFPYVDKQRFKEIFATKGSAVSPIWTPVEGFTNNESIPLTKSANS